MVHTAASDLSFFKELLLEVKIMYLDIFFGKFGIKRIKKAKRWDRYFLTFLHHRPF
jgi:hypothetical protein